MPFNFDFLGTPEGQDKFSILAGNLGQAFGAGSPGLEKAGEFAAGLGYSGRLEESNKKNQEFWKQVFGQFTGPDQPGPTGFKNTGKGFQLDMGPAGDTDIGPPASPGQGTGGPGGTAATAPFPQAPSPVDSTSRATSPDLLPSINTSQMLSALAGSPGGSVDWLTPEMAIQVMGQQTQNRQLANQFATAMRGQELAREKSRADQGVDIARIAATHGGKIPVDINTDGSFSYNPNSPNEVTPSDFASAKRSTISESRLKGSQTQAATQDYVKNLGGSIKTVYEKYTDVPQGLNLFDTSSGAYRTLVDEAIGGDPEAQGDLRQVRVLQERKRFATMRLNKNDFTKQDIIDMKNGEKIILRQPVSRDLAGIIPPVRVQFEWRDGKVRVVDDNGSLMVY